MKKNLFVTTIFILLISFVSAQTSRFGFSVGLTMANMQDKNVDEKVHGDFKFGPTFGILLDVPMERNGSFQVGLNFVQKGTKDLITTGIFTTTTTNSLSYLEMPLNVLFKIRSGNGNFRIGGGPAAGLSLSGKSTSVTNNVTTEKTLKFGTNTTDDLKGVDIGLNAIGGYEFDSGFFITLNYTHGISTLLNNAGEHALFNRYFGLRAGWLLKGKMKAKAKK